jgi:hypothetical protein
MKTTFSFLRAVTVLVFIGAGQAWALEQEIIESTVKIFCPSLDKEKGGIEYDDLPLLPNGEMLNLYHSGGSGTGFVFNDQGYIMTNNHVVGVIIRDANGNIKGFKEEPNPVIYVVQKKGSSYLVHRAIADWQSANRDVAIIHCPTLKAKPLPLDFSLPHESDHVISCGFPGASDLASEDRELQHNATNALANIILNIRIKKKEKEKGMPLTEDEKDEIAKQVVKTIEPVEVQWNLFLNAANPKFQGWKSDAGALDISSVVNSKEIWKAFFAATVTEGNIEKVLVGPGFEMKSNLEPIGLIQHNLDIRHGNSGGPLMNAEGDVIGVVGRAWLATTMGDREQQTLATRVTEAEKWMKEHKIGYVSPPWRISLNFKITAAISVTLLLALAAVGIALVRRRAAAASGYTTVIEDKVRRQLDAMLAKEHPKPGTLPAAPAFRQPDPYAMPVQGPQAQRAGGKVWILGGRDPQGRAIRLEVTEGLLGSRSDGVLIGRSAGQAQLVVNHDSISKQHAQLRRTGAAFLISDRQSANGTAVNGRFGNPYEEMPLRIGDTLTLGEVKLQFTEA